MTMGAPLANHDGNCALNLPYGLHAPDFDGDYALTGGVFSRLPAHLEQARRLFRVGNLYLNRGITGARIAIQPFGGVGLSGTGVQAGGPEYLKQFLWSRVVSSNTLRHGYVPELGAAG